MINLGGIDFELNTLAPNPTFNYIDEYIERKMLSGKIRRIYKGKRFNCELVFGYLNEQQISNLYGLLNSQQKNGFISATITMPNGSFSGNVNLTIDEGQKRYAYINNKWIWTNWKIIIDGVDLIK